MITTALTSATLVGLAMLPTYTPLPPRTAESAPASVDARPDTEQRLLDNLDYFDVPIAKRETVLTKFRAGQLLDAFTDRAPIRIDELVKDGDIWVVERFEDGSYDATTMEADSALDGGDDMGALGIEGCKMYSSAGVTSYQSCKAQKNMVYLDMKFWVDFSRWSGGSSISNARDWDVQVLGASYTLQEFGVTQAHGYSDANPAKARLKVSAAILGGLGGGTPWIEVRVSPAAHSLGANW
jgi:hypothetical protein